VNFLQSTADHGHIEPMLRARRAVTFNSPRLLTALNQSPPASLPTPVAPPPSTFPEGPKPALRTLKTKTPSKTRWLEGTGCVAKNAGGGCPPDFCGFPRKTPSRFAGGWGGSYRWPCPKLNERLQGQINGRFPEERLELAG